MSFKIQILVYSICHTKGLTPSNLRFRAAAGGDGNPKVAIDNIAKGLLKDGQNLKTKHESFSVNGDGGATLDEFNVFISKVADYVGKEISGIRIGDSGSDKVKMVRTAKYEGNSKTDSKTPTSWLEMSKGLLKGHFHTHPFRDHTPSSDKDVPLFNSYPKLPFYIIAGGREKRFN
ncbi:hypothetical protein [Flavobacterium sp. NKUCC04_CG]|uniref:hypothetical protein n=1 Tax=Flavobacterium sp. NKUCC04_CG TaxID=2842121 RepID=UPI001C5AE26B|nr:hypothetical protein [Flavobacterium sp. NKUCC04_CG]MBW3520471.1 hypothetical protein [Flavobacterium sp. NKUCC04_CG]